MAKYHPYGDNKADWGPGPWQDEPDEADWVDEATGLHCKIRRGPVGALCGYVKVSRGHPLFGCSYSPPEDYWELNENQLWWRIHVNRNKRYCLQNIDVHGGLTFSGLWHDEPDNYYPENYYFGFDCAHAFDFAPRNDTPKGGSSQVYRDWAYVKAQVESLAKQLKAIK